jgi:hypothetical protein
MAARTVIIHDIELHTRGSEASLRAIGASTPSATVSVYILPVGKQATSCTLHSRLRSLLRQLEPRSPTSTRSTTALNERQLGFDVGDEEAVVVAEVDRVLGGQTDA